MNEENMDNKNMTVREMWHYLMFQTKGVLDHQGRRLVLGALTTGGSALCGQSVLCGHFGPACAHSV